MKPEWLTASRGHTPWQLPDTGPATRSFQLKNIRVEARCEGFIGRVVNFFSPLLTKKIRDMVLFRMPSDVPFTVEKVRSGDGWIAVAGHVDYRVRNGNPANREHEGSPASSPTRTFR